MKDAYNDTPLHLAALEGKLDVVKFFIEDLNCEADNRDQFGSIPLHQASQNGHLNIVQYLVDTHHCDPLCQDEKPDNSITFSLSKGSYRCSEVLYHSPPL